MTAKSAILYIVHIVCENVQTLKLEWATTVTVFFISLITGLTHTLAYLTCTALSEQQPPEELQDYHKTFIAET